MFVRKLSNSVVSPSA
uniref:Uncharacterized protein n=1 Tax=Rhizophora mucronata TaxID=61149 RepID=A0A2P2Q8F3_RHIMU